MLPSLAPSSRRLVSSHTGNGMACAAQFRNLGAALGERNWHAGHTDPAGAARSPAALQDGAQCEVVQALTSAHTGLLSARLCRNLTHGQLVVDYSNATERVVLLRVGGPHPQTVIFERGAAASQWIAPFRTCTPGTYTLHALFLTLDPWGQGELGFAKRCHIHHTPEAVLVRNMSFWTAGAQPRDARASCQRCLWSWNDPTHDWEARALFSHFAPMPHPYRFEMARRFRELRWIEPAIAPSEERSFSTPADRLPLCLVGDSHMRNLANMLVAANRSDCDVLVMQATKSVCNSSTRIVRHFRANEPAGALKLMKGNHANMSKLSGCKAIIASFGQWQISDERSMHSLPPYSPARYAAKLRHVLNSLRKLGETLRVPVAWMPINPMPLTKGLLSNFDEAGRRVKLPSFIKRGSKTVICPPTHWVMPHIAHALNAAAQKAAAAAGVAFFDTWHIMLPLIDTSFDGAHYGTPAVTPVTWIVKAWLEQQGQGPVASGAELAFGPRQRRAAQHRGGYTVYGEYGD